MNKIKTYKDGSVLVAYSNMEAGNMGKKYGDLSEVMANRAKLREFAGDGSYVLESVEGGNQITDLSDQPQSDNSRYKGDGLFTTRIDVVLQVIVADCLGMVIYDGVNFRALGLIHVGRSGAGEGIHTKALKYLIDHYKVPINDVRIFMPPCIRQESYYLETLPDELQAKDWHDFIKDNHIDLVGRIKSDLFKAGLRAEQISEDTMDVGSMTTPYFSHRLQSQGLCPPGRNAVAVRLLPG